jgi:hypothetical protein
MRRNYAQFGEIGQFRVTEVHRLLLMWQIGQRNKGAKEWSGFRQA